MKGWGVTRGRFAVMTIVAAAAMPSLTAQADRQQAQFVVEMHAAMQQMMTAMDGTPT
jgi:type II secretory pathway pseudopilin PulG